MAGNKIGLMRYYSIAVLVLTGLAAFSVYADEEGPAKGVEVVSDTVTAAANKTGALLCGKLEFTMTEGRDKYKEKEDYTVNVLGQKVPASTRSKTWKKL